MKGDFARISFNPKHHYSQVFQQQGRVLLEADWNEQAQIQLHLLRTLVCDLVGRCWAVDNGFAIIHSKTDANGESTPLPLTDWMLAKGHIYVDGILCVNEVAGNIVQLLNVRTPEHDVADGKSGFENPPARFALWLDVWERHLCAVEAPGIVDPALDGVDTASRAQVVWQLRLLDMTQMGQQLDGIAAALQARPQTDRIKKQHAEVMQLLERLDTVDQDKAAGCVLVRKLLDARAYALPRLHAELGPQESDSDPCVIAADARYRGCENQLYRVEIHRGGVVGTASFKWSRENGSVVFPVTHSDLGARANDGHARLAVTLGRLGRDARLGLAVDDWVELVDDGYTLGQRAYPLLRVIAIDPAICSVTLYVPKDVTPWPLDHHPSQHPLLRRWDQREEVNAQTGVLAVAENTQLPLEDGINVTFEPGGIYVTGQYWLIPARVNGNRLLGWPPRDGTPVARPPRGSHHHALLGIGNDDGGFEPCCCHFAPLCDRLMARAHQQSGMTDQDVMSTKPATAATTGKKATKATKTTKTTRTAKAKKTKKATKKVHRAAPKKAR